MNDESKVNDYFDESYLKEFITKCVPLSIWTPKPVMLLKINSIIL